ncbi:MAG: hypothetical protein J5846_11435, partial [Desulfovibrio sp.]|nr:hypothetical protein [Desulfovibrio sp.]
DLRLLNQNIDNFKELYFGITFSFHLIQFIVDNYTSFTPSRWKDPKKAKAILAEGYKLIINSEGMPEVSELTETLDALQNLLIASEREKAISFKYN